MNAEAVRKPPGFFSIVCDRCKGTLAHDGSAVTNREVVTFNPSDTNPAMVRVPTFDTKDEACRAAVDAGWKVDGEFALCRGCREGLQ